MAALTASLVKRRYVVVSVKAVTKPRVSVVQYLNTVPLVWGMLRGEQQCKYEFAFTTPAGCADAVRDSEADIGIIPSIEYQRIDGLRIINGVSIAANSEVKSVLLLSSVPAEDVRTVAADNASRTSVALVRILLEKFYLRQVEVTPADTEPDEMLKRADAALVIGDPALAYHGPAPHVYDLGSEWWKFTGLPFVFAFWAGREDAWLEKVGTDFRDSRDYGRAHIDEVAAQYAPRYKMTPQAVKFYLTQNIDYNLNESEQRGLRLFYKLACDLGMISEVRGLELV
jgi:chorismate dehydratase